MRAGGADPANTIVVAHSLGGSRPRSSRRASRSPWWCSWRRWCPAPYERPGDWSANTGHGEAYRDAAERDGRWSADEWDEQTIFFHDVPPDVVAASADHLLDQSDAPSQQDWPLAGWPEVPTHFLLCRDDRFFPAEFQRKVVAERLGIVPDEMSGGHLPALAHPDELVGWLLRYAAELPAR